MRSRLRELRLVAVRWIWRLVFRLVPPRPEVVVYGWPDSEENSLRFAVHAARHGTRSVSLLLEDPDRARRYVDVVSATMPGSGGAPLVLLRKNSFAALRQFARAEVVAYTHGLFTSPPSGRGRVHVNLWHGHGPKLLPGRATNLQRASDFLVANSAVWGGFNAQMLATPETELLTTGDPRQDAFEDPPPETLLHRLGLDPDEPLVVWLPTFRNAPSADGPDSHDGDALSTLGRARDQMATMQASAQRHGVQLIVKPHPYDRDTFARSGIRVVSTDEIFAAGGTLYGLLSASAGLVSDYSSVWVEYLELDRPVGLFCPDLPEYERRRGFKEPTLRAVANDLLLQDDSECDTFMMEVTSSRPDPGMQRALASCRETLGIVRGKDRSAAVMARIEARLAEGR